jgi:hypothetical protein
MITGSVSFSGGVYTYSYTLTVDSSDTGGVSVWGLLGVASAVDVTFEPPACDPTKTACDAPAGTFAPVGWSVTVDYALTNDIFFQTITPVSPGTSLGGFGFFSTQPPGIVTWFTSDDFGNTTSDMVVGPAPEPATWALMLCGLGIVVLFGRGTAAARAR